MNVEDQEQQQQPTTDETLLSQGLEDDAGEQSGEGGDETLELDKEATPEDIEAEKQKKRSQRWDKRVDSLTARLRDAERRAVEAEAKVSGGKADEVEEKEPDPNDEKYEFGRADPAYVADLARHQVKAELAERDKETREAGEKNAEKAEFVQRIETGMDAVEKAGVEKYDDFEEKIAAAAEARDGEPLHPLIGIGIATSPVGADVAYKLATDEGAAERIEKLAKTNPQAAAVAFGELEGEFADDDDDLNIADPLDMARALGRMRARIKGGGKAKEVTRKTTKAPIPPEQRARGGSGQFEVGDDTEDFAAFEAKVMGKK